MSLRHTLSQFTKFVLGDLRYMMHYHGNCNVHLFCFWLCVWYGHHTHFTHSLRCLPASVPSFDQAHSTSAIRPLMWRHLGAGVAVSWQGSADCLQHYPYLLLSSTILRAYPYSVHLFRLHSVMFYCSLVLLLDTVLYTQQQSFYGPFSGTIRVSQ